VNTLASKLNLDDDQTTKIPILADRQQKLTALKADTSMRRRQKKGKLKDVLEDSDKRIKAVLNDQQKRQYTQLEQQMKGSDARTHRRLPKYNFRRTAMEARIAGPCSTKLLPLPGSMLSRHSGASISY
jgi:hypothetical protein